MLPVTADSNTSAQSGAVTSMSVLTSDSVLSDLITPQRPRMSTGVQFAMSDRESGLLQSGGSDERVRSFGQMNGMGEGSGSKGKSPGLLISENYTNEVIRPQPV